MNWQKLYYPLVVGLLHSPLHRIVDKQTLVITVTGRKSGKRYTLPVSISETKRVLTHSG